jgi:hypothetical protein
MNDIEREVDFEKYCKLCKHSKLDEKFDPCCECLEYGYNQESERPVNFKEKE